MSKVAAIPIIGWSRRHVAWWTGQGRRGEEDSQMNMMVWGKDTEEEEGRRRTTTFKLLGCKFTWQELDRSLFG